MRRAWDSSPQILSDNSYKSKSHVLVIADPFHFITFGIIDVEGPPVNPIMLICDQGNTELLDPVLFCFEVLQKHGEGNVVQRRGTLVDCARPRIVRTIK